MGAEELTALIQSVGFPIVLVIAMGWFIWQLWKQSAERENKLMDFNEKALATLDAYANTLGIYADRLGVIEEDVKFIKDELLK